MAAQNLQNPEAVSTALYGGGQDPVNPVNPVSVNVNIPNQMDVNVIQTQQQLELEGLKIKVANALLKWYTDGNLALVSEAFNRMFPGIGGAVTAANGNIEQTSFLGNGCVAYSGLTRIGSDVFSTTMTPNKMQDQLDAAWLPTRLDTDPLQLTFPILGGVIVNGTVRPDYNPEVWDHAINVGATMMNDTARILSDNPYDALPVLGYRLLVKAIDNHVGDTRVILTGYDTSRATEHDYANSPVIFKTTLHMGVTAVNNFTGQITVVPLHRTGLVNLNGEVSENKLHQLMFSGMTSERLQDYEVMMNVARRFGDDFGADFTLRIDAANAIVYVLPIYPLLSDYSALTTLIASGSVRSYVSYLHMLSNNSI